MILLLNCAYQHIVIHQHKILSHVWTLVKKQEQIVVERSLRFNPEIMLRMEVIGQDRRTPSDCWTPEDMKEGGEKKKRKKFLRANRRIGGRVNTDLKTISLHYSRHYRRGTTQWQIDLWIPFNLTLIYVIKKQSYKNIYGFWRQYMLRTINDNRVRSIISTARRDWELPF